MGRLILLAGLIVLPVAWQGLVNADEDYEKVYEMLQSGEIRSLEDILKISRQEVPGKVIEVELERENGVMIYELEILDRYNRVWEIDIDAVSGEVLKVEED